MATTLGVAQARGALISDLICARPRRAGERPYLISVVCSSVFHEQLQPQAWAERHHAAQFRVQPPRGEGAGVWKANAFYPFISLMTEEEKNGEWLQMYSFLLPLQNPFNCWSTSRRLNNLFIPSRAANVRTTLNFQKQLGLQQQQKPSFWWVDRWAGGWPRTQWREWVQVTKAAVTSLFGTRDRFHGRQFVRRLGGGDGFRMIQVRYICYELYLESNAEADLTGAAEDETVGWHHWCKGLEFEQAPGDSEGQGCLACCSPWDRKESDTTERLNSNRSTAGRLGTPVLRDHVRRCWSPVQSNQGGFLRMWKEPFLYPLGSSGCPKI